MKLILALISLLALSGIALFTLNQDSMKNRFDES